MTQPKTKQTKRILLMLENSSYRVDDLVKSLPKDMTLVVFHTVREFVQYANQLSEHAFNFAASIPGDLAPVGSNYYRPHCDHKVVSLSNGDKYTRQSAMLDENGQTAFDAIEELDPSIPLYLINTSWLTVDVAEQLCKYRGITYVVGGSPAAGADKYLQLLSKLYRDSNDETEETR